MTRRVAFLRAVNLGKRRVPMARLAEVFRSLKFDDVSTHVNSGNVVFTATGSRTALESRIERRLEDEFGFEVTTFVRTRSELDKTLSLEPFPVSSGDTYFVTFLKKAATASQAKALEQLSNPFDTLKVSGLDVHWRMRGKSTDSRLKAKDWDTVVGRHNSTSRNMNMLRTLVKKMG